MLEGIVMTFTRLNNKKPQAIIVNSVQDLPKGKYNCPNWIIPTQWEDKAFEYLRMGGGKTITHINTNQEYQLV